jgi:glycosyltransferase involved in cell wall biosynthesis
MSATPLDASVVIPTFNRAPLLDATLASLERLQPARSWEVIVVDNNSTDDTKAVVDRRARGAWFPIRYLLETRQGRSSALNAGIAAARGAAIAMTDDDVQVADGWLDAVCDALLSPDAAAENIRYAGGPVEPMWEIPPPGWLDLTRGDLWGTIAIQDHGSHEFLYEDARKVPLGANMAAERSLFDEAGLFRGDLGRSAGGTILGQEVPEWLMRVRAVGGRGRYVPAMRVRHHIPAARLTRRYFRRWWYGKGVSRAALERMQPVTELGIDLRVTPHVFDVPRYMFGSAARDVIGWLKARAGGDPTAAARHEMMLAYFAGYVRARHARAT